MKLSGCTGQPGTLTTGSPILASTVLDEPQLRETFKTGFGFGWHQHCAALFEGTERFFRPSYAANLIESWIPALTGVEARLKAGGKGLIRRNERRDRGLTRTGGPDEGQKPPWSDV